jgi:hypothetical protein
MLFLLSVSISALFAPSQAEMDSQLGGKACPLLPMMAGTKFLATKKLE